MVQMAMIMQPEAGGWLVGSCGEAEAVHAGDGLDGVVEVVAALSAGAEDLAVLYAGEDVLRGRGPFGAVCCLLPRPLVPEAWRVGSGTMGSV
jgi:hypothetical protein